MGGNDNDDPIVRIETHPGAPTGEGTTYVTKSGARWRSSMYGGVEQHGRFGTLVGGSKFGPMHVRGSR